MKKFSYYWRKFTSILISRRSEVPRFYTQPENDEPLTVFSTGKSDSKATGMPRHTPFLPSNKFKSTSVFRILDLSDLAIWGIGVEHVKSDTRNIYGRFDFIAEYVYAFKLRFEPDNKPERHANIVNWPEDRSAKNSLAQQLAAIATFKCEVECNGYAGQAVHNKKKDCMCGAVNVDGVWVGFFSDKKNNLPSAMESAIVAVKKNN